MASRLQNKRRLKAVILNFMMSGVSYVVLLLAIIGGLFPYSSIGRFGNLGAASRLNYWVIVVGLFLLGTVFLAIALWPLKRFRSNVGSYQ